MQMCLDETIMSRMRKRLWSLNVDEEKVTEGLDFVDDHPKQMKLENVHMFYKCFPGHP